MNCVPVNCLFQVFLIPPLFTVPCLKWARYIYEVEMCIIQLQFLRDPKPESNNSFRIGLCLDKEQKFSVWWLWLFFSYEVNLWGREQLPRPEKRQDQPLHWMVEKGGHRWPIVEDWADRSKSDLFSRLNWRIVSLHGVQLVERDSPRFFVELQIKLEIITIDQVLPTLTWESSFR